MLSHATLLTMSVLVATGLAVPVVPNFNQAAGQLAKRFDLPPPGKVCLSKGSEATRTGGACGPVLTGGLPGIALPMSIFDPHTPSINGEKNPNLNPLCGMQVDLTNNDYPGALTIRAVVTDRNREPPLGQTCTDSEGEHGPVSIDVDLIGWDQLRGTQTRNDLEPDAPIELAVLSYKFVG